MEKIGFVSASSAQAVREVASSGDEIREMTENIAISLKTLAAMVKELEVLTARFKVDF